MTRPKRMALSLKPEVVEVITKLAKLNGMTKTSIIQAMLTDMLPAFKMLVKTIETAKSKEPANALKTLKGLMTDAGEAFNEAQLSFTELENDINGRL